MNFKSGIRSSEFFNYIGQPSSPSLATSGKRQAIVYDVEKNGKFTIYKIFDNNNEEIELPVGSIVARIPSIHDGVTADKLPVILPNSINQEMPIIGNQVWLVTDESGNWYWESVVSRLFFSQKEMDKIEDILGARQTLYPSAEGYNRNIKIDITNNPENEDILPEDFTKNKEGQIDSLRQGGFPVLDEDHKELRKMPGESGIDGRMGNGLLLTYGDLNNGLMYLYSNRNNGRPDLRTDNIISMGQQIENNLLDEILKVREYFTEKQYPLNIDRENITYFNADQFRSKINKDLIQIINGTAYIGINKNVLINILRRLELTVTDIILNVKGEIDITNSTTKLVINGDKINIDTTVPISFNSSNDITITSKKKLTLEGKQVDIKGKKINVGTETTKLRFNKGFLTFITDIFIGLFNSHIHGTTLIGAPTTPPLIPTISETVASKIKGT